MAGQMIFVQLAIKQIDIANKFKQILDAMDGVKVVTSETGKRPQILVYELSSNIQKDFKSIQSLLQSRKVEEIFLTSENIDQHLLMEAMRTGVKEFFQLPIDEKEVGEAIQRFKSRRQITDRREKENDAKIISVIGTNGGVGVTTVAVNLGFCLAQSGNVSKVAVFDMNRMFGDLALLLEISPKFTWGEITDNVNRLDETFLMNVLSKHSSGMYVLPSPGHLNGHKPLTPEITAYLLNHMKTMFDYVIIDAGQSTSIEHLKALEMSNDVLLVSILTIPCLSNTSKLMQSLTSLGYIKKDDLKIIINRHVKKSEISVKDAEESIHHRAYWIIPNDYRSAMTAVNKGQPLTQIVPKSPVSKSLMDIADTFLPNDEDKSKRRWFVIGKK
jgi:pilus assembly protein CpaE